jgi:ribosomal protein S18 acetylase RimI-like enzyme
MFTIRAAKECDVERMRALNIACLSENYPKSFWKSQFKSAPHFVAVPTNQDTYSRNIVGYIAVMPHPSNASALMIYSIAVRPQCRRKGIARSLLQTLIEYLQTSSVINNNVLTVTLNVRVDNLAAISLYKEHGFVVSSTQENYYADNGSAHEMILKILK